MIGKAPQSLVQGEVRHRDRNGIRALSFAQVRALALS
jgi:hypothetical protein